MIKQVKKCLHRGSPKSVFEGVLGATIEDVAFNAEAELQQGPMPTSINATTPSGTTRSGTGALSSSQGVPHALSGLTSCSPLRGVTSCSPHTLLPPTSTPSPSTQASSPTVLNSIVYQLANNSQHRQKLLWQLKANGVNDKGEAWAINTTHGDANKAGATQRLQELINGKLHVVRRKRKNSPVCPAKLSWLHLSHVCA